ncbi:MAG: hypothetical protein WDZ48_06140 [Pirellulales bacterium]
MIHDSLLQILATLLNSVIGFMLGMTLVITTGFWLLSKLDPFNDQWRQWEGSIITAIKLAEKEIPEDAPHSGLTKLNTAMDHVLQDYALAHGGKRPSRRLVRQLRQGIQTKHADLDRFGGFAKP